MNTNCIVVYESIYNGNTEKLAKAMACTLGCKIITATEALSTDLNKYKAIGLGSGIYFGCHHPSIFEVVKKLNKSEQDIFIFSSRGNPMHGKYHGNLKKLIVGKGKRIIGEFTVKGYDETGPFVIFGGGNCGKPNEKDIKHFRDFLHKKMPEYCMPDHYLQVKAKQPIKEGVTNSYSLLINNNHIILRGDLVTINQNVCVGCGKCESVCPLHVIEICKGKAIPLTEKDCTLCELCIKNCNERAINLHYTWRDALKVASRHGKRCSL